MAEKREILNAPGFFVTRGGKVYDSDGVRRNEYRNGDGYLGVSIKTRQGFWTTFGIQRLVAEAYVEREGSLRIYANHIDGNIENNHADNIDWVTAAENNIHASLMRDDNRYPKIAIYGFNGCGPGVQVSNLKEAACVTGLSEKRIWLAIKYQRDVAGYRIRHTNAEPKDELRLWKKIEIGDDGKPKPKAIKMLDIDNGDLLKFDSLAEAGRYFSVSASHIYQSIPKNDYPRFFQKKYQVAYEDEDFQNVTALDILRGKGHGAKEVIAYSYSEKRYVIFTSAASFYSFADLSKKSVTTALAKDELKRIDNWSAIYYSLDNSDRLKDFVEGPAEI